MANHYLSDHFRHFFSRLNPRLEFERTASSEYRTIKGLIEDRDSPAGELSPWCFLQGSYRQETAIYTINDIDVVALCELWQPGSPGGTGKSYGRDEIFDIIAAPLLRDSRYRSKVRYRPTSTCIKVDLGIKVEILPVVYKSGNSDPQIEPFRLYRPETQQWEDGYARYHQAYLSLKNKPDRTDGNFIPVIKILKHLRSLHGIEAVSFHVECLLHSLPDSVFKGSPADYIPTVLGYIADTDAETWYRKVCKTPCGERNIFTASEWAFNRWAEFHKLVALCARGARLANQEASKNSAIELWRIVLGEDFFPKTA